MVAAIADRLRADLRATGDFRRIHTMPQSGADVPDDTDARLVVLGTDHSYSRDANNKAQAAAAAILQSRGNSPRLFQNTLVFLAVDQARLQDLDEAVRRSLAWSSILAEQKELNLDPHQVRQAETQQKSADSVVAARIPEAYQWLLVPVQTTPQVPVQWQAYRQSGQESLAVRASKKLRSEELLVPSLAGTRLRMELDRVPLWRGDHVSIRQLTEDFARYVYLPRLCDPGVLAAAVQDGLALLLWQKESFAYADSYDEAAGRYRGLRCGQRMDVIQPPSEGLLVKPDVAYRQQQADQAVAATIPAGPIVTGTGFAYDQTGSPVDRPPSSTNGAKPSTRPTRYHGTVDLDATRAGRDAGRIAEEVIAHLSGIVGAKVTVTLEIEATVPEGVPENVVRTVTENSRTLKFTSHGFEKE